jgi:alpha-L-rhamnosidase
MSYSPGIFALAVAWAFLNGATSVGAPVADLVPEHLLCEFQQAPIALQTPQPRFGWILKPAGESLRDLHQTAYRIMVSSSLTLLASGRGDMWDSSKVRSGKTIQISYDGKPLSSLSTYYWSVQVWDQSGRSSSWSQPAQFRMGLLDPQDWKANWIGGVSAVTARQSKAPLPIFRHEFAVDKPIAEAMAFVSGLGQYELHINGMKVGNAVLTPGWTNYRKTVLYNTYDLTKYLREGRNAIGIVLGNGMYNVQKTPGRYTKFVGSFGDPKLIFQALIGFIDGSSQLVVSDSTWRFHTGPIVFSSPYGGEDYDARLQPEAWDCPGFDDQYWRNAIEVSGPGGELVSQQEPEIKVQHVYTPQRVTEPVPGIRVYDLGQNFAGWPEIAVRGSAGSTIKLIPGELLDASGLVTQKASGGPQWFSYTLRGGGLETWHPRFSYYGFRYIELQVQAAPHSPEPEIISISGKALHAAVETVGHFRCSNELFNQIHRLIDAAIRSNMQSLFTDCPHREKLGWLEQSHLLGPSIMYNYEVSRLYEAISDDMRDAQTSDGLVPDIAPEYVVFSDGFRDSPEWGSAVVLDPWIAYQYYGDLRNIEMHYNSMRRYVSYLGSKANDGIIAYGLGDWYDIGPGEPGLSKLTTLGVTATATYYQDLVTLERITSLLDDPEDAKLFRNTASAVRRLFNSSWYNPETHSYDRGSQTDEAMPLALDLCPREYRPSVLSKLIEDIRAHQNHTTAGDIGFHYVVSALTEAGRSDVLFDMLSRTDSPSYGYQLLQGATTLTEAWDANSRDSQDHLMLGAAEEWFYRGLAGLDFDLARATPIVIHPFPVGNISEAEASYQSSIGTIISRWKKNSGEFLLDIAIPPNVTAVVYMPAREPKAVTESGRSIAKSKDVHFVRMEGNAAVYRVNSGVYRFAARN